MPPEPISVAILAKAPIAGYAKTRLISALGANGAAELHERLIQRTVATALKAAIGPVILWCAPDCGHPVFVSLRRCHEIMLRAQAEGDLGDRMHAAFVAGPPASATLLVGTDCPTLTPEHLQDCANELACNDAVFLPAEDGGYVLVGLNRPEAGLFKDIPWGTAEVMETTRCRLASHGLGWSEPTTLWDLDRPEDLERWRALTGEEPTKQPQLNTSRDRG
ncbi:hypothetical protein FHS85_003486 [Rhodoligotrophos appendicifer]|uniref:TIGR04282 family arsenosugar biosynthesis glycosyltransferase n=1 Tax=Rhodoligotrophos appendicifer TaxID=987056 RepID=UPI001186123E|nr:TIGR04282 family arsenosugar biosynthesis glycosyltransferase [Rhodoligotrophos appendicifer]